jgi:hypothetical protein
MIDPRLNDRGFSEAYRVMLAYSAGLIPADHPQLWKDSALHASAERAEARRARDAAPQGEAVRLFTPAPAQMSGQLSIGDVATVDGGRGPVTGTVYYIRDNGWPSVETSTGRIASGPRCVSRENPGT